jgi:hypothetical protein
VLNPPQYPLSLRKYRFGRTDLIPVDGISQPRKIWGSLSARYCYVLMENHCHLVVMTPEGNICEIKDPFEAVKWQQVLGGEGFLRKLKDQWNQRVERPKNYRQKKTGQLSEPSRSSSG